MSAGLCGLKPLQVWPIRDLFVLSDTTVLAKLMLVPMLLPVIDSFGIDRVHFGIIIQLGLLIGIATPPMGIGL